MPKSNQIEIIKEPYDEYEDWTDEELEAELKRLNKWFK